MTISGLITVQRPARLLRMSHQRDMKLVWSGRAVDIYEHNGVPPPSYKLEHQPFFIPVTVIFPAITRAIPAYNFIDFWLSHNRRGIVWKEFDISRDDRSLVLHGIRVYSLNIY